jgi:hypothetical protein
MELNHMKKELRQHNPSHNYQASPNYSKPMPQEPYRLGNQHTTDVVNESRIDRQLPGFSNNVNVSRMSMDQGFSNQLSHRMDHPNVNMSRNNNFQGRSMHNNTYHDKPQYGNPSGMNTFDMDVKTSFNPSTRGNYNSKYSNPSGMMTSNQNYSNMSSSRLNNNSFGMGDPVGFSSTNIDQNPKPMGGGGGGGNRLMQNPSGPMSGQMQRQSPGQGQVHGQVSTQEIEKGQLEQFNKFLMSKKSDIEAKLRTMPKVCRRVADKREKLQLNKELDEVVNELDYVQNLLRGS